jgi:hypothetical protein
MCEKIKTISKMHEWQDDVLASAVTTGIVEGANLSYTQPATRARHQNFCHIRLRNWDVTFTQLAVTTAGIKDAVAREVLKALKALSTDYEKIFLNSGNSGAGTTASARTCKGLVKAIVTNTAIGTGAGSSANIQITEDNVNLVLQKVWAQGGDPKALMCGGFTKRVISKKFTAKTGFSFNMEASARKAIANINKYEGSFGTLDIIPDRFHMTRRATILTPEMIKIAVLRDIEQYKGAPTASSVKGWVEAEMTLQWGNQKGHGKLSYLRTGGAIA